MPELAVLRDDLSAFADAAGAPLTTWQAEALRLETRTTAIVAPRQSGKSRSLALLALWWSFRKREQRVLVVSAGEEAARRLLSEVRRIAANSPWLRPSVVDENAGLLALSNGSEVRSVPASERQVRGWSVDLLLIDEAALVPDELILDAALPTTAARRDARIVLASSATVASGAFYDFAIRGEQGSEHVQTFRWRLADAEWISPSVIAAARESMSLLRFAAEYEGVFAGSTDALLTPALLQAVTHDFAHLGLDELRPPARFAGGVDWGLVHDRTVFSAVGRLDVPGPPLFAVACSQRWPEGFPNEQAIAEIVASPGHFSWLVSETNGLGGPLTQSLFGALRRRPPDAGGGTAPPYAIVEVQPDGSGRRLVAGPDGELRPASRRLEGAAPGFVTLKLAATMTAPMKAALFSGLRLLIERRQLLIPRDAEHLVRELLMLRVELTEGGGERVQARSGHDDAAVSLALALRPVKRRDGWGVGLLDVARAGGLREDVPALPRLPGWRSVVGDEVTGAPALPPAPDRRWQQFRERLAELKVNEKGAANDE